MTWTYVVADLTTDPVMQVRYLVGDTKASDPLAQDEEIAFALAQRPSIYGAAATVCRSISAKFSRDADVVDRDLRTMYSARSKAYANRAAEYENASVSRSGALPYAGGISISDKRANEANPDRVQPQFGILMDDNYLPVPPVGNEGTPPSRQGNG